VVLLVLMCVATFASMWISNVAAPTLCYALIKVSYAVHNEAHTCSQSRMSCIQSLSSRNVSS
jgi:phosphate transporter